jgi:hypothetical protein
MTAMAFEIASTRVLALTIILTVLIAGNSWQRRSPRPYGLQFVTFLFRRPCIANLPKLP